MNEQALLIFLPNIISILVTLGVFLFTWRRRDEAGAAAFSWYVLSSLLYTLFGVFELFSNTIGGKRFWGNLRFVVTLFGPLVFLNFALTFTRRKLSHPERIWKFLIGLALLLVLVLYTDFYHHWVYPQGSIASTEPFSPLNYEFTVAAWIFILYGYGVGIWGLLLLISAFINARKPFRSQIFAVIISLMMPLVGVGLTLAGITIFDQLDTTYIAIAISSTIIALALFRFRLFDIVPIARDMLIEKMHDMVLVFDDQTRLIDANPAALSFLNLGEKEVIGRRVADVIPDWDRVEQQYIDSPGNPVELVIDNGGDARDLSVVFTSLLGEEGKTAGQIAIARDITGQKQIERRIKQYNKQLEILNRELEEANQKLVKLDQIKDDFLANVSHELRSPMTNIRLYHELIDLQPKRVKEFMETLSRETVRLADLIESLLALTRFDQGVFKLDKSYFDLGVLIKEYVQDRRTMAENRNLSLSLVGDQEALVVCADRKQIGQVFSNILTNALNYTPGGGKITINMRLRNEHKNKWAGFSVQDSGLGITLEDQEQLFTRFFRGRVGTNSAVTGTGLGLAISKEIVDRHGGEIIVESQGVPGEGAIFTVWLPFDD